MNKQPIEIGAIKNKSGVTTDVCLSTPIALLDEAGEKSGWYKQIVSKVNSLNDNTRIYPKEVYEPALFELKEQGFPYPGEHPHPPSYLGRDNQIHYRTSVPNSAVQFRDAYIDMSDNVWAEYRTLETEMGKQVQSIIDAGLPIGFSNRMSGVINKRQLNSMVVEVAEKVRLFTWDVLMNPAEKGAFSKPLPITDEIKNLLINFKESEEMDFNALAVQHALADEVNKLPYDAPIKNAILERGKTITEHEDIASFIKEEKALVDAVSVHTRLTDLGVPQSGQATGRAAIIEVRENNPAMAIVDGIMSEMDRELMKRDTDFKADPKLRKANMEILDGVMAQLERDDAAAYKSFMKALKDEAAQLEITDGITASPAVSGTGEFAQSATISLAILRQTWQDLKFLQLCMTEGFEGSTYKMPVEFQSPDLYTEDDFYVGELEGIPTESVQTFMLEYGAEWLKRGFIITREAEEALRTGPFKYNIIAANAANIAQRFSRIIDRKISTEMISRADEYQAVTVKDEVPESTEIEEITAGVNAPETTNASYKVSLLCGRTSPLTESVMPPLVRPRVTQWLDETGRAQKSLINAVVVKAAGGETLKQGVWNSAKGQIVSAAGTTADYAVDFENAVIYFAEGTMTASDRPTISQYAYATNIVFFNLTVPDELKGFDARYYNRLLELIDAQQAYMGSAPRYVTPDFLIGSLQAMVPYRQAELFYKNASPDGTSLLGGEMYFGRRNGVDLGAHNAPWAAGDSRLLLGKRNATRVGMGSSYALEGPFPHMDGKTGQYTSAKTWNATQQIAINTPLVIDESGNQYHPPFRTIKYFNK